jgi:hypothetical protein
MAVVSIVLRWSIALGGEVNGGRWFAYLAIPFGVMIVGTTIMAGMKVMAGITEMAIEEMTGRATGIAMNDAASGTVNEAKNDTSIVGNYSAAKKSTALETAIPFV